MQHRDMASFSSNCYSSSPQQPSSSPSFDNNGQVQQQYSPQEQQQHQSSLSSLESFLFLPQLPVDGDDGEDDAWQFIRHNHQRQSNQQKQQFSSCLLTIANPTTKSSSSRTTGTTTTTTNTPFKSAEDNHETKCNEQNFSNKREDMIPNTSRSPFCGGKLCNSSNSLFPCTAANSTVIAAFPSNHSNNDDDADDSVAVHGKKSQRNISSLNILISKNSSGGINNSSHNHSHSPACLTANHHHLHQKDKSLNFHERCHPQLPQQYHLRHFVRRRLYIFRICQVCFTYLFGVWDKIMLFIKTNVNTNNSF